MTVRGSSAEELRLLSLAINETDKAVLVLDEDRRIVYLNRAFTVLFGYSAEEVRGRRPTEFLAGPSTDLISFSAFGRRPGAIRPSSKRSFSIVRTAGRYGSPPARITSSMLVAR